MPILELKNIHKTFGSHKAVNGASLEINPGEIVALAGESGCGKTTLAKILLGLENPDSGELIFDGKEINLKEKRPKNLKKEMQMVFQNPFGSFNPKFSLQNSLSQPLIEHKITKSGKDREQKLCELFDLVSLESDLLDRFPHQVSGGQMQRAAIARAIASEPRLLVADEPTSALDVSIRSQILNLLKELKAKKNLSCLVISHDLPSLKFVADKIYVMHKGEIVEQGPVKTVLDDPKEKYTQKLIAAIPSMDPEAKTFEYFKKLHLAS